MRYTSLSQVYNLPPSIHGMLELEPSISHSKADRPVGRELIVPKAPHRPDRFERLGKTTLLRLTLADPVRHGLREINTSAVSFTPTEWADRIGYVPQRAAVSPINGKQNVSLVPDCAIGPPPIETRVEECAPWLGWSGRLAVSP